MCGINGIIQFNGKIEREQLRALAHLMNSKIVHRGPDSEGLYEDTCCGMGMRRLSIIDISGGTQPIWNEKKNKLIFFNGEVYNFQSLRDDLISKGHIFYTKTDTEVILHGYEEYGTDIFNMIDGMFALVIYDILNKKWIIARDRCGEKPLYYYRNDNFFLFGSELKSLLCTELFPKTIDKRALEYYMRLTYIPAPYSIIEGVRKLQPAHYFIIDASGKVEKGKYWELPIDSSHDISYEEAKKKLRDAFFTSVEQRMISDVPLGAFLSGGFDSTSVVGAMAQSSNAAVKTFTVAFKDRAYDESNLARIVSKKYHTDHKEIYLDWNQAPQYIEEILENMDEPFADSSLIATYAISKETKKYVSVALTGDGGDELFAGYDKYLISYYSNIYLKIPQLVRGGALNPIIQKMPKESSYYRKANKVIEAAELSPIEQYKRLMSLGFKEEEITKLFKNPCSDALKDIDILYNKYSNIDNQMIAQYVDFSKVLEGDMLTKVDRGSMLASLETRVPILSREIIELAFEMPSEFKLRGKHRKIIWKDTFSDLIPEELQRAPKKGFRVPIGDWLRNELKGELLRFADEQYIKTQGIFDYKYIKEVIEEHVTKRKDRYSELWAFFVFQHWYETYILNTERGKLK